MSINRCDKTPTTRNRHGTEPAAQIGLPNGLQIGSNSRPGVAASGGVATIGGPIIYIFDFRSFGFAQDRLLIFDFAVCGAAFEAGGFAGLWQLVPGRRGQGVESVEFCLEIAGAGTRGSVDQTVAGHDAVDAGAADPVVWSPTLFAPVHELDAGSRWQQIVDGRLAAVASVMEPVCFHVRSELAAYLPCLYVVARPDAGVATAGDLPRPRQTVDDQYVLRGIVPRSVVRASPQAFACLGRGSSHFAVPAGEQHNVIINNQRGSIAGGQRLSHADRLGTPVGPSALVIQADDFLAVVKYDALSVARQAERRHRRFMGPEDARRLGIDGEDGPRNLVPGPLFCHSCFLVPADRIVPGIAVGLKRCGIDQQKQSAVAGDDFFCRLAFLVRENRLAGSGIQRDERLIQTKRYVNTITDGDKTTGQECRAALERIEMCIPQWDRSLPKDRPVEGISGNKMPFGRQLNRCPRTLVHNVEKAPVRRDQRIETAHVLVVPSPSGTADPL